MKPEHALDVFPMICDKLETYYKQNRQHYEYLFDSSTDFKTYLSGECWIALHTHSYNLSIDWLWSAIKPTLNRELKRKQRLFKSEIQLTNIDNML